MRIRRERAALIGAMMFGLVGAGSCTPFPHNPQPPAYPKCIRGPLVTDQTSIAGELTKIYRNCAQVPKCERAHYQWGFYETKSLDGYSSQAEWVWQGYPQGSYSVLEQDAILFAAIAQALHLKPANKQIIDIAFFADTIPAASYTGLLIGAKVKYAACSTGRPE